jgi:hypothetical protein
MVLAFNRAQLTALSSLRRLEHVWHSKLKLDSVLLGTTWHAQRKDNSRSTDVWADFSVCIILLFFKVVPNLSSIIFNIFNFLYRLYNPTFHDVYSPAVGSGLGGGQVPYSTVCDFLTNGAIRQYDAESRVPYAYQERNWISYDDEQSLEEKVIILFFSKTKPFSKIASFSGAMD